MTLALTAYVDLSRTGEGRHLMPYTVQDYLQNGINARLRGEQPPDRVQVRAQGVVRCARILDVWYPDPLDPGSAVFKLKLDNGTQHYARPSHVRQCEGIDGHCQCAHERSANPAPRGPACGDTERGSRSGKLVLGG